MIGDKLLQEPQTMEDVIDLFEDFGFCYAGLSDYWKRKNSKRLVELNNEVYERYKAFYEAGKEDAFKAVENEIDKIAPTD